MIWNHAQPALLYLVPGVLGSVWITATVRGELSLMWHYTEAIDEEEDDTFGSNDKVVNSADVKGDKHVTRSQSKATKDITGGSDGEGELDCPRRSRRSRPQREIFSFTIEAPRSLEGNKTNNKHARSATTDTAITEIQGSTPNCSTAVDTGVEPAGKRQRLR